jgi:hypothetical protein
MSVVYGQYTLTNGFTNGTSIILPAGKYGVLLNLYGISGERVNLAGEPGNNVDGYSGLHTFSFSYDYSGTTGDVGWYYLELSDTPVSFIHHDFL